MFRVFLLRAWSPEEPRFPGNQVHNSQQILVGWVIRGLALLERLRRSRRRGVGPGLPPQNVKDIRSGDAQCKASLLVPVVELVRFVPLKGLMPLNGLERLLLFAGPYFSRRLLSTYVGATAKNPCSTRGALATFVSTRCSSLYLQQQQCSSNDGSLEPARRAHARADPVFPTIVVGNNRKRYKMYSKKVVAPVVPCFTAARTHFAGVEFPSSTRSSQQ